MKSIEALLERYSIGRELGRGGMGCVYECLCRRTRHRIALKLSLPNLSDNARDLCQREAKIVSEINHPNVARVYGHGLYDDQVWIAMEVLEGGTLEHRLGAEWFTLPKRLRTLRELAGALADLHAAGIVHNDLKPSNVMFGWDGRLCLIDFGIAEVSGSPAPKGLTITGTPYALPPERILGLPSDHRADIFQLGVLAYDLFCTEHPWRGRNSLETISAICNKPSSPFLDSLATTAGQYLAEMELLSDLVKQSLQVDPANRIDNAHPWVTVLDRVIANMIELGEPFWSDEIIYDAEDLARAIRPEARRPSGQLLAAHNQA